MKTLFCSLRAWWKRVSRPRCSRCGEPFEQAVQFDFCSQACADEHNGTRASSGGW